MTAAADIEDYVSSCEEWLWDDTRGRVYRRWLTQHRALYEDVLRANRVGADPGARQLPRADGMPGGRLGVTFPILDEDRRTVYVQKRLLIPGDHKYLNPVQRLCDEHGRPGEHCNIDCQYRPYLDNPRVAFTLPGDETRCETGSVIICEGMPDALTAAQYNWPAVALLGTSAAPDPTVALRIACYYDGWLMHFAVDRDDSGVGQRSAVRLSYLLAERGVTGQRALPIEHGKDLNDWQIQAAAAFDGQLRRAMERGGWEPHTGHRRWDPDPAQLQATAAHAALQTRMDRWQILGVEHAQISEDAPGAYTISYDGKDIRWEEPTWER